MVEQLERKEEQLQITQEELEREREEKERSHRELVGKTKTNRDSSQFKYIVLFECICFPTAIEEEAACSG